MTALEFLDWVWAGVLFFGGLTVAYLIHRLDH